MPLEITQPEINAYAESHTTAESDVLAAINRETHAKVMMPRMLSGHLQGRLLSMVSHMVKPLHALEIGTYTGYSSICLAEGIRPGGKLVTIDSNDELESRILNNIARAGMQNKIQLLIGKAADLIPTLQTEFDLVFIDADKINYALYYDLVWPKVRLGGYLLVDNVLWSGKVIEARQDKDTLSIVEFNKKVQDDPRVENVLLPIRDGIMMIRKLSL